MAKTQALGTILKQGTTVIGNITSIGVPSPNKSEIDVTDFASVAAEVLPGLADYGELPIGGFFNYADAGQTILRADANDVNATTKAWSIIFVKQGMQFQFNAFVKSYIPRANGPNEAYGFDATLRVTGAVTTAVYP
jgi:hypothetical protein